MWCATVLFAAGILGPVEVVGPFRAGLEVRAPSELTDGEVFGGAVHPVRWHAAGDGAQLDLAEVVNLRDTGVVHLRSRFEVAEPTAARLAVRSDGPWRLAIDGAPVASGGGHHPESPPYTVLRWLDPGPHRVDLLVEAGPGRSVVSVRGEAAATGAERPIALPGATQRAWRGRADRYERMDDRARARFDAWRGVGALAEPPPADPGRAPEHPGPWLARGDAACAVGDGSGAASAWSQALVYDPGLEDVRAALVALGQTGLRPLDVATPRAGRCVPVAPSDATVVEGTLAQTVVELRRDGTVLRLRRHVGPTVTAVPDGDTLVHRRVLRADGLVWPCPSSDCPVAPGDRVDVAWLERVEPGVDVGTSGVVPVVGPVDRWAHEVRVPAGRVFRWDARGVAGAEHLRVGEVEIYRWSAEDVPARPAEPDAPALAPGDAYVAWSTWPDWVAVGRHALRTGGPGVLVRSHAAGWLPDVPAPAAFDVRLALDERVPAPYLGAEALRVEADGRVERVVLAGEAPWIERTARLRWALEGRFLVTDEARRHVHAGPPWPLRVTARHGHLGRRARPRYAAPERVRTRLEIEPSGPFVPPPGAVVESRFGRYTRAVRRTPDGWVVERSLELTGGRLEASAYGTWRAFLRDVDAADEGGW